MAEDQAQRRDTQAAPGGDEVPLPDGQHLGPDEPGVPRPEDGRERDHRVGQTAAQGRGDRDRQDQGRERQKHVGDAHQDLIGHAAEIARDRPDDRPDRHREDQHHKRDLE